MCCEKVLFALKNVFCLFPLLWTPIFLCTHTHMHGVDRRHLIASGHLEKNVQRRKERQMELKTRLRQSKFSCKRFYYNFLKINPTFVRDFSAWANSRRRKSYYGIRRSLHEKASSYVWSYNWDLLTCREKYWGQKSPFFSHLSSCTKMWRKQVSSSLSIDLWLQFSRNENKEKRQQPHHT